MNYPDHYYYKRILKNRYVGNQKTFNLELMEQNMTHYYYQYFHFLSHSVLPYYLSL